MTIDSEETDKDQKNDFNGNKSDEKVTKSNPISIDKWCISSPDKVKIIGCGDPAIDLINQIYSNYSTKLKGINHSFFNKPTKPDYLDLKLMPDYKNIHGEHIKREIRATLAPSSDEDVITSEAEAQKVEEGAGVISDNIEDDQTLISADQEQLSQKPNQEQPKPSIFNKLKMLLSARGKTVDESVSEKSPVDKKNQYDSALKDNEAAIKDSVPSDEVSLETREGEEKNDLDQAEEDLLPEDRSDELPTGDQRDVKVVKARAELNTELNEFLENTDLLFIITDLSSKFGLDNSLIASKVAKQNNIITIGLVILPQSLEKLEEVEYGNRALHSFRLNADIIVAVPHLENLIDGYLVLIITELLELVTTSGLVNLDVADVKNVVGSGNVAMLGFGAGHSHDHNKIMEAIDEALSSPILKIDLNAVNRTLVNVTGDSTMTITEAQKAARVILGKIQPDARLIWGAAINPKLKGAIKVMIMAGISPKNILVNIYANS